MTDTRAALIDFDRTLLREYSVRTLRALEANVDKEFEKDCMVIDAGVAAATSGGSPSDVDTDALFGRTRDVDRTFIQKLSGLPVSLELEYDRIGPVRVRRIEHLLDFVFAICRGWQPGGGMAPAVQSSFDPQELQRVLAELLHLYAQETRFVCDGARLRGPARLVGRVLSERVTHAMQSVKDRVAQDTGERLYASTAAGMQHRAT
jgi:hypothetical protein